MTSQLKEKHAPNLIGVAYHCNLAFKALSNLSIFAEIEKLLLVTHLYFSKSLKRLSEVRMLAELIETKGLKLLRNVQTRWVSLIEPLRRLLSEHKTLIYKMTTDLHENNKAEVCWFLPPFFAIFFSACVCTVLIVHALLSLKITLTCNGCSTTLKFKCTIASGRGLHASQLLTPFLVFVELCLFLDFSSSGIQGHDGCSWKCC